MAILAIWLAGSVAALLIPRAGLTRIGEVGPRLDYLVNILSGEGAGAVLDIELALHCYTLDPPGHGVIGDPEYMYGGSFVAWPGTGYAAASLGGEISAWDRTGAPVWSRSLLDGDAGLDEPLLDEVPWTLQPRIGNDGKLYVFGSGGTCHLYDAQGSLLEGISLRTDANLAGPLLVTSTGEVFFSGKDGRLWMAVQEEEGAGRRVSLLPGLLQDGAPWLLAEGATLTTGPHNEPGELRPLVLVANDTSNGMRYAWRSGGRSGVSVLQAGEYIHDLAVVPEGNLLAVGRSTWNRFYLDPGGVSTRYEKQGLHRPIGEFLLHADRGNGEIFMKAAMFEIGGSSRLLHSLTNSWPLLRPLRHLHGGGLLYYDPVMQANYHFSLPDDSRMLGWPDEAGNMLVLERSGEGWQAVAYRLERTRGS